MPHTLVDDDDSSEYSVSKDVCNKLDGSRKDANLVPERWEPVVQKGGRDTRKINTSKKILLFFLLTYYQELFWKKILVKIIVSRR